MTKLKFYDYNGVSLEIGTPVVCDGTEEGWTGRVDHFTDWDVVDGPGGDLPALYPAYPAVVVKYVNTITGETDEDSYSTRCREQHYMEYDDNRVCDDVEAIKNPASQPTAAD